MDELEARLAGLRLLDTAASEERAVQAYRSQGVAARSRRKWPIRIGLTSVAVVALAWTPVGQAVSDGFKDVFNVGGREVSVTKAQDGTPVYAPTAQPILQEAADAVARQAAKGHGTPITAEDLAMCEEAEARVAEDGPVDGACAIVLAQRDNGELEELEK